MKRRVTSGLMAAIFAFLGVIQTGCFGEFALTRKVYSFNQNIGNQGSLLGRFVNNLVFIGLNIIPIYGIAGMLDLYIFNLIEFWIGSNPLAMAPGEMEQQRVNFKGHEYLLTATQNQFEVAKLENGEVKDVEVLKFNTETATWMHEKDGSETFVCTVKEMPNGTVAFDYPSAEGMETAVVTANDVADFQLARK